MRPASSRRRLALPGSDDVATRLAFGLCWDLLPVLRLIAAVGRVSNLRFASAQDIAGSGFGTPSPPVVIAVPLHLVLATLLPFPAMGLIPLLALQFALGRIFLWRGYPRGAGGQAFGFGATLYPSLAALPLILTLLVL